MTNLKQNWFKCIFALTYFTLCSGTTLSAESSFNECKFHDTQQRIPPCRNTPDIAIPPPNISPFMFGLNLTNDQEDKIFEIIYPGIPKHRNLIKQKQQLIISLRDLSKSDKFDETLAKIIVDKLIGIEKEELIDKASIDNRIYKILSSEQRYLMLKNQEEQREFPF